MNDAHPFDAAMQEALALAAEAAAAGEVPVGAVAVLEGRVVGRGRNRREEDRDPTAHAELLAIQDAARTLGRWRLTGVTVWWSRSSPAPCAPGRWCSPGSTGWSTAPTDPKAGAVGSLMDLSADPRLNHRFPVERGLRAGGLRRAAPGLLSVSPGNSGRSGENSGSSELGSGGKSVTSARGELAELVEGA